MKTVFNIRYKMLCAALVGAVALSACDDEEVFDVRGTAENKVYVNMQSWAPIEAPKNSAPFKVVNTPIGSVISDAENLEVKFPVRSTHPAASDIQVQFAVDHTLVQEGYAAIPAGVTVTLTNAALTIARGATLSADSVVVSVAKEQLELLSPGNYMIPIKITSASNATVSTNLMVAYVLINTSESNIRDLAGEDDIAGTLLDRTGWTASVNATLARGSAADMFTTSTFQYWRVDPGDATFDFEVDMAAEQSNVTGIRLHTNSANYNIVRLAIETSLDGENWTSQGEGELAIGSSTQYVGFYQPVDARYLRITVLDRRHSSQVRVARFEVYSN